MERIGVFCSSHNQLDIQFVQSAHEFGEWLGSQHKTLVYGGSRCGLMEELAHAVKNSGGFVVGVVPDIVSQRSLMSDCIDVEFRCANLSDRKDIMLRESDIFVALPGGIGTLDEIFTVTASNTIGYHTKRVLLYNVNGFWDVLWDTLSYMQAENVISSTLSCSLVKVNSFEELKSILE